MVHRVRRLNIIDHIFLQLLTVLHVLNGPIVTLVGLHSQFDTKDHVTGSGSPDVSLIHQQFGRCLQVEKGLITEFRLTARLSNKQDLGHAIEIEEECIGLLIYRFVAFQQVDLKLDLVDCLLLASTAALMLLASQFGLLHIFDIESDFFTELQEGLSHVFGDQINSESNDIQVNQSSHD